MFDKILIANRGEIACRVIDTARRLGIATVAVFSDADVAARHVALADEAYRIGPPPADQSYLRGDKLVELARRCAAGAIHPGYGFLSESAAFAEACAEGGVVFVGPSCAVIRAMGDKRAALKTMRDAGVPVLPGYLGEDQSDDALRAAAEGLGYPLLIKPSAGGGGKGMQLVHGAGELASALASARRVARRAFDDDALLLEIWLPAPRHVEVQVMADTHGNAVHLFDRDCSVQRRHQKIIEEAPAPGLSETLRKRLYDTALRAARAIGYVGAGTVEFLLDTAHGVDADARFYFMEMNTRLQVEHPVTELITGEDLVEWQLRIAAGEPLPRGQDALAVDGHAVEARLYAEDPARDFLPQSGAITALAWPETDDGVRVDTGVQAGDTVSVHYDPLLAKLCAHGADREAACARLRDALSTCRVEGIVSNREFLLSLLDEPEFVAGGVDTGLVSRHPAGQAPPGIGQSDEVIALAALFVLRRRTLDAAVRARRSGDPFSPWHASDGWRLNQAPRERLVLEDDGGEREIPVEVDGDTLILDLPGGSTRVTGELAEDGRMRARVGDTLLEATVTQRGDKIAVERGGALHELRRRSPRAPRSRQHAPPDRILSPMPGTLIAVHVHAGQQVTRGTPLVVVEAMKMEHTLNAPADGTVEAVHVALGDRVDTDTELLVFNAVSRGQIP